jgi:hypothetical protein
MRTVSSYQYEQAKHKVLFDMICDEENWKNPIHCVVPRYALPKFSEACSHFTGGALVATKSLLGVKYMDMVECTSDGYYANIGA